MVKFLFESGDVFEEHNGSSNCIGDAKDFREQVPFVVLTELFSCNGKWLTREACNDAVHQAAKWRCWEVLKIAAPNRGWLQGRVFHTRSECGARRGFPLSKSHMAGMDSVPSEGGGNANVEHPCSGTKAE